MRNNKGFTIIELLISVGVLVAASPFVYMLVKEINDKQRAVQYADMTKTYTKAYTDAIKFNYANYYQNAVNNPNTIQVIKYSDIQNQGFAPNNTSNQLGIKPCVALKYNSTAKEMQAILFYTSKQSNNKYVTKLLSAKAVKLLGAASGYYNTSNGSVIGSGNGWSLANGNSLVNSSNAGRCDYTSLTDYGVVMNLNLAENFPKVTDTVNYLSKVSDDSTPQGDTRNSNTMQTSIVMDSTTRKSAIFLEGNANSQTKPMLISSTKGDDATSRLINQRDISYNDKTIGTVITSKLLADGLTSTKSVVPFTYCDAQDIGTFFRQQSSNVPLIGQLVCNKNLLQCQGVDPNGKTLEGYCYLPANDLSIRYHPNTAAFNCPVGYIDPTMPATATSGTAPAIYGATCHICTNRYPFGGSCMTGTYKFVSDACTWNNPQTAINNINPKTSGTYAIYQGVSAQTTWSSSARYTDGVGTDCSGACSGTQSAPGVITSATCTTGNPVIDSL